MLNWNLVVGYDRKKMEVKILFFTSWRVCVHKDKVITHLLMADCPSVCLSRVDLETDWKPTTERLSGHISGRLHQNSATSFLFSGWFGNSHIFPPLCFRKELKGIHLPDPCYLCLAWVRHRAEGWTSAWMQLLAQQKQATVHEKPAGRMRWKTWRLGEGKYAVRVRRLTWGGVLWPGTATPGLWSWESEKKRGGEERCPPTEAHCCHPSKKEKKDIAAIPAKKKDIAAILAKKGYCCHPRKKRILLPS